MDNLNLNNNEYLNIQVFDKLNDVSHADKFYNYKLFKDIYYEINEEYTLIIKFIEQPKLLKNTKQDDINKYFKIFLCLIENNFFHSFFFQPNLNYHKLFHLIIQNQTFNNIIKNFPIFYTINQNRSQFNLLSVIGALYLSDNST